LPKLQNINFANGVTVVSADPLHPAALDGVIMQNVSGLTFRDLEIRVQGTQSGMSLNGGSRDNFEGLDIHGKAVGEGSGLFIRSASKVQISNVEIHDVSGGINIMNTDGVTVRNNKIHDLQVDGMQVSGSSNVTISGNYLTNFFPKPGDHSDAIQFYTYGTKESAHDISITENTYVRGGGLANTQGIFMGNEAKIDYVNITISRNVIVGSLYHGLSISGADNLKVSNNVVEGYRDLTSWIMILLSKNSEVRDNIATSYMTDKNNDHLSDIRNKKVSQPKVGDLTAVADRIPPPVGPTSVSKHACGGV
jgi:nitrous oxidase accessory protein NosD